MRYLTVAMAAILIGGVFSMGCAREDSAALSETILASERVETWPIRGVIRDRTTSNGSILFEHEEIPGYMGAMTMSFRVTGADVATLPPSGAVLEGTLNVAGVDYWLSDLRRTEAAVFADEPPAGSDPQGASVPPG